MGRALGSARCRKELCALGYGRRLWNLEEQCAEQPRKRFRCFLMRCARVVRL